MQWADWYRAAMAITAWREARGEGVTGMRAVMCVIRNRVNGGLGDWDHVITAKWQFSSMTAPKDPELVLWPDSPDQPFEDALQMADGIFDGSTRDITQGATHYFNPGVVLPDWAAKLHKLCTIGHHEFYGPNPPATEPTSMPPDLSGDISNLS